MKFSIKKYMGDDSYSWAVFRAQDVKGMRSPICNPHIRPVVCGCSRMEANGYKKRFEAEAK